ncbi:hypothetical protein CYLTODRAFT_324705, partial [Cylindrobasidium torrendii FP15055 ss-10]
VREKLGLSYKTTAGMHERLNEIPRRAGKWQSKHIYFPDKPNQPFILLHRDILEAIQALWGDPALADHLVYKPKKMFADEQKDPKSRAYTEMWTAEWWWIIQDMLPPGHTIASLIISTDKTQLTQFSGGRQAYPVYLTLGNIPSSIRRKPSEQACILIAYLPVEKVAKVGRTKPQVSAQYQQLFHAAMTVLFEPIVEAGKAGVEMISADGSVRLVHPILAAYVADYPEQCLVTCSKYGSCPKCQAGPKELDERQDYPLQTPEDTLKTMREAAADCDSHSAYTKICMEQNVNGNVDSPFWEHLPYTNIHLSQTPDVLHQLYQGVVKYLLLWCQKMM